MSEREVLFEQKGALGLITLNRPKALNALTRTMCFEMDAQLVRWLDDTTVATVLVRGAGERAFCAGGDVRALYKSGKSRNSDAVGFYRDEYRLNARIKHFSKPYVALLHGIVMGGGVGVSVHGSHRIVDTGSVFAMPETGIGLFPDVGGSYFLPRLPGEIGMYIALSGARLKAPDIMYAGVATHCVASVHWDALIERLAAGEYPDSALSGFEPETGATWLSDQRTVIDTSFSQPSVEAVLGVLDADGDVWSRSTAATIRTKSPTSLKLAFRQLREGRSLGFDDCMRMEFRLVNRVMAGHDFYEGVRAAVIDKDGLPAWRPASLAEVRDNDVDSYFAPLGESELSLLV